MKILNKLVEISRGKMSTYGKKKQPRANSLMSTHNSIPSSSLNTMSTTLSNIETIGGNYIARKREFERIDYENLKIKKYIESSKPVLSVGESEQFFKTHLKLRSSILKGKTLLPIGTFIKHRQDVMGNLYGEHESPKSIKKDDNIAI